MEATVELKHYLKALRLSPLLSTLPERVAYARGNKLTHLEFLEMLLSDEVERREQGALERRLQKAKVNHAEVLETFDWEAKVTLDRDRLKGLIGLEWLDRRENVILTGPVGVGKTFIANALAHVACRRNKSVIMVKAAQMFKNLYAARADHSLEKELIRLISPSLLVIDDFGLERLSPEQAHDFYEIVAERYERNSTIITSNRHVTEWVNLFDDTILANSALDRLAHNAHQMIVEGESYRKKKATKRTTM
jgi:DNA replication protein DnaC